MIKNASEISPLVYARIAGSLYLIIFCLGIFAELFVRHTLLIFLPLVLYELLKPVNKNYAVVMFVL